MGEIVSSKETQGRMYPTIYTSADLGDLVGSLGFTESPLVLDYISVYGGNSECEKQVPAARVNRDGECKACQVADKASDMGVGDINSR